MSNIYLGYHFTIEPKESGSEILIAELGEKPFESFIETDLGIVAYIQKDLCTDNVLEDIFILNSPEFKISYTVEEIDQVNWNEEWEKNFEPIDVDGNCHVRAPFHPKTDAEFDIVIEPKMSLYGLGLIALGVVVWYILKYMSPESSLDKNNIIESEIK